MQETILTAVQTIIGLSVTLLTAFAIRFLLTKIDEVKAMTESDLARKYLDEAARAVTTAVDYTSQTYVGVLKEENIFTLENQKEALQKALITAKDQLTKEAEGFIQTAYGDVNAFLTTKIEAELGSIKRGEEHKLD